MVSARKDTPDRERPATRDRDRGNLPDPDSDTGGVQLLEQLEPTLSREEHLHGLWVMLGLDEE